MRVSLDSNILVYALHVDDRRNPRAIEVLGRAALADCVQTMQSLAECFNVLVRKRGLDPAAARHEITRFHRTLDCVAARPSDLDEAMRAVIEHAMSFWDAMLWATAKRAGCRIILSEDMQDGRDLEGVRFLDPFKAGNREMIDLVLPPLEA
jgi:predicted nucleic acid-binding protein